MRQLKLVGQQVARDLAPVVLTMLQIELSRLLNGGHAPRFHLRAVNKPTAAPPPESFLKAVRSWPNGVRPERLAAVAKLTPNTTRIYVWRGLAHGLIKRQSSGVIVALPTRKSA